MDIIFVLILLITGLFAGLASGLLGIGGGFIMTPVQYWLLTSMGFDATTAVLVAFGTNLFVVFPTALSGAWRHTKEGAVLWKPAIFMGVAGAMAAILGVSVATILSGELLRTIFGAVVILCAIRMLTAMAPKTEHTPTENAFIFILIGVLIGFLSGLLGIGGGIIAVPAMTQILKFKMHSAVGTSTVLMALISIVGAITYVFAGLGVSGLPQYSIGYVNLLNWVLLASASIPMAQIGAKAAHKLPAKQLKYLFTILMIYIGLRMIGVFELLGIPL
jgi:hypothetical protein